MLVRELFNEQPVDLLKLEEEFINQIILTPTRFNETFANRSYVDLDISLRSVIQRQNINKKSYSTLKVTLVGTGLRFYLLLRVKLFIIISNPYIYDVDVFLLDQGKEYMVTKPTIEHNGVKQDIGIYQGRSDCFPQKRQLVIEDKLTLTLFRNTKQDFMSDILVVPQFNAVYVVTDTYKIHEVRLEMEDQEISRASFQSEDSVNLKPILQGKSTEEIYPDRTKFAYVEGSNHPIVFSSYGAVMLEIDPIKPIKIVQLITTPERITILDVHVISNYLYVACATQGIDIYEFKDKYLKYVTSIVGITKDQKEQKGANFNIIDVSSDASNRYLIALDANNGLYFFDLKNENKYLFNIFLPNVIAFNHYEKSFYVIAQTVNGIEYVAELFVDIAKQNYYFNRIYIEDTAFYHIEMTPTYALLVSEDDHIIIDHSIYNEFIPQMNEIVTSFTQEDMIKLVKFDQQTKQSKRNIAHYIGLAKGDIKVFKVTHESPGVLCTFNNVQDYKYRLEVNATRCNATDAQPLSPYEQCRITQLLNVQVQKAAFESDSLLLMAIFAFLVGFCFIVIVGLNCICNTRWRDKLQQLKAKLSEAKKYATFQEVEVVQINNEDAQQSKDDDQ